MPQRPQPNRRRGLLRAALAIIVLLVLLIAGMLIVASATAPPATAPAVPLTPPALATPILPATPAVILTPKPARPNTGNGTSTTKKHKAAAGTTKTPKFMELRAGGMFSDVHRSLSKGSISQAWTSPNHAWSAAFVVSRGDPAHARLRLKPAAGGSGLVFPDAYALSRPVWTKDSQHLFFLRETSVGGTPGARWSIVRATPSGRTTISTRVDALNATLLGMSGAKLLYLVANITDTSLYTLETHGPHLAGIPMSEPVTTAFLSPSGKYIAFASPANCNYCSLDIYDVHRTTVWNGPAGVVNERAFTWTAQNQLVTVLNYHPTVVDPVSESVRVYNRPTWLPSQLGDTWSARVRAGQLTLTNAGSHAIVSARETGR